MGACVSRDRVPTVEGAHVRENFCYQAEAKLGLYRVEFRTYQAAIKRFGYRIDLTEQHLRAIAPEIRLNVDEMKNDPKSAFAIAYLDTGFAYKEGRHQVEELILIGWLLCTHWSEETQARELWHIVNPGLAETVPKSDVNRLVASLMYVAVSINTKLVKAMPASAEKDKALAYLETCQRNRKSWAVGLTRELGAEVTEEELMELMKQFFRSYDLRMSIAGDKKNGEEDYE